MKRALLALCVLALASCGGEEPPDRGPGGVGDTLRPGELRQAASFCPGSSQLLGVDVSQWQGQIDWNTVAASGNSFAIIRTSSGSHADTTFATNWEQARAVGLVRGTYHYFYPEQDAAAQARMLLDAIGWHLEPGDLPPTLDVEEHSAISKAAYARAIRVWMDTVEAALGVTPMIYTGRYFWNDEVGSTEWNDHALWLAAWNGNSCQNTPDAWGSWRFHQYAVGPGAGFSGDVDHDRFDGSLQELLALANRPTCTPHCEGSVIVDGSCGQGDCAAYGSRCVDDELGARCAFAYCPDRGEADVCVSEALIGHCSDGALTTGDCSAYAAFCSTAGVEPTAARCVSAFCVESAAQAPVSHDGCWLEGGELLHCDAAGGPSREPCPDGEACSTVGGSGHCAPRACPASGDAPGCAENAVVRCYDGAAIEPAPCGGDEDLCDAALPSGPACVSSSCRAAGGGAVCLAGGGVGHCDELARIASVEECPDGTTCTGAPGGARCVAPAPPDGGDAGGSLPPVPASLGDRGDEARAGLPEVSAASAEGCSAAGSAPWSLPALALVLLALCGRARTRPGARARGQAPTRR